MLRLAASRERAPKRARAPSRASSRNEPRGSQVLRLAGPRNALGHRPEPEVLPLPAETSREAPKCCAWQHQEGGPRNALGHRPEPEVLPLPAETSREAPKCCAWQHQGGGPSVCVEEGERRSEEELGARRRSVGRSVGRSSVVGRRSVGGRSAGAAPKVRTPHNDVGNK